MNATASKRTFRTLLERFDDADSKGRIDIDEEGGIAVDTKYYDKTLADDLLAAGIPPSILAGDRQQLRAALRNK